MTEEDMRILSSVRNRCERDAEFMYEIMKAAISGVMESEKRFRIMAADMETAASAMTFLVGRKRVSKQLKEKISEVALSKIGKYHGKSFLNWSDSIKKDVSS